MTLRDVAMVMEGPRGSPRPLCSAAVRHSLLCKCSVPFPTPCGVRALGTSTLQLFLLLRGRSHPSCGPLPSCPAPPYQAAALLQEWARCLWFLTHQVPGCVLSTGLRKAAAQVALPIVAAEAERLGTDRCVWLRPQPTDQGETWH